MEKLDTILFYTIDKAIRSYRQFAQKRLREHGFEITIDQWLVMKAILENPKLQQNELSELVFKDAASVNRIIGLLVKGGYLERKTDQHNRRKTRLKVTAKGEEELLAMEAIIHQNRSVALTDTEQESLETTMHIMELITRNTRIQKKQPD